MPSPCAEATPSVPEPTCEEKQEKRESAAPLVTLPIPSTPRKGKEEADRRQCRDNSPGTEPLEKKRSDEKGPCRRLCRHLPFGTEALGEKREEAKRGKKERRRILPKRALRHRGTEEERKRANAKRALPKALPRPKLRYRGPGRKEERQRLSSDCADHCAEVRKIVPTRH